MFPRPQMLLTFAFLPLVKENIQRFLPGHFLPRYSLQWSCGNDTGNTPVSCLVLDILGFLPASSTLCWLLPPPFIPYCLSSQRSPEGFPTGKQCDEFLLTCPGPPRSVQQPCTLVCLPLQPADFHHFAYFLLLFLSTPPLLSF